jgi:hypothetical protein
MRIVAVVWPDLLDTCTVPAAAFTIDIEAVESPAAFC